MEICKRRKIGKWGSLDKLPIELIIKIILFYSKNTKNMLNLSLVWEHYDGLV